MSQILKLTHENQQLKRQVSQYKQVLGVSPFTDDSLFKGGYRVVKTIADRDKIDCCHRKQGMKVIVVGEDLSFKEYILKTDNCKENTWEEISVTVEENEVFLIEDYSELSEDLMTQKDLNLVLKQLILNLQTALDGKLNKGGYVGTAQDIYDRFEGKITAGYNSIPKVGNGASGKVLEDSTVSQIYGKIGIGLAVEASEKLEVNGNVKAIDFIGQSVKFNLQSSITPTPNTLVPKTDGSGLLWYDNNSVLRNIGENFFSADLSNTTARNHTMNAGVTVNTLGNPHTLSGLPNKNTDIANFRKVRVQNNSGLDSVVDSKNLLTDGVTSMTDEEKDAWRLAQRKSTETYSTSAPRIDYILPFVIKREDAIQYIMLQGINLYVNPETAIVKIVNISTLQEYDVLTNSITVYANDFNKLQFSFNFSTVPAGSYKIKLVNNSVQNIDNTTFDVVDSINSIPISCSWETVQSSNSVFTTHNAPITTSNSIYQKCATVNDNSELTVASVSKSSALLTQTQANGDWIITLDITHNKNNDYWGGWFVGLMKSSINIDLLNNIDFGYGRSSYIYKLIPLSNINIAITTANTLVEKFIMIKTGLKIALFWVNGSTFTLIGVATLFENINSDLSLVLKTYGSNYQSSNGSYNNSDVQVQISSIISK